MTRSRPCGVDRPNSGRGRRAAMGRGGGAGGASSSSSSTRVMITARRVSNTPMTRCADQGRLQKGTRSALISSRSNANWRSNGRFLPSVPYAPAEGIGDGSGGLMAIVGTGYSQPLVCALKRITSSSRTATWMGRAFDAFHTVTVAFNFGGHDSADVAVRGWYRSPWRRPASGSEQVSVRQNGAGTQCVPPGAENAEELLGGFSIFR